VGNRLRTKWASILRKPRNIEIFLSAPLFSSDQSNVWRRPMTYSWMGTAVQGRCRFIENADCQRSWKLGSGLSRGSCDVSGLVLAAWIIPLAIVIVACTMTLAAIAKLANSGPSHQRRFKTPIMSSSFC
jgi:hypothetical protein